MRLRKIFACAKPSLCAAAGVIKISLDVPTLLNATLHD